MFVPRYPVRSLPNGYGTGVSKPNTDSMPTGVCTYCDAVLLGVGVTVNTARGDALPPNVAIKLLTNASRSADATYTCVVSYCGPTDTSGWRAASAVLAVATSGGPASARAEVRGARPISNAAAPAARG